MLIFISGEVNENKTAGSRKSQSEQKKMHAIFSVVACIVSRYAGFVFSISIHAACILQTCNLTSDDIALNNNLQLCAMVWFTDRTLWFARQCIDPKQVQ